MAPPHAPDGHRRLGTRLRPPCTPGRRSDGHVLNDHHSWVHDHGHIFNDHHSWVHDHGHIFNDHHSWVHDHGHIFNDHHSWIYDHHHSTGSRPR